MMWLAYGVLQVVECPATFHVKVGVSKIIFVSLLARNSAR